MNGLEFLGTVLLVLFLLDNLTGGIYQDLLVNNIDPALTNTIENNENYLENIATGWSSSNYALPITILVVGLRISGFEEEASQIGLRDRRISLLSKFSYGNT